LPQFSVSANKGDNYRATEALSLARIKGAILDTPVRSTSSHASCSTISARTAPSRRRGIFPHRNGRGAGTSGGINDA